MSRYGAHGAGPAGLLPVLVSLEQHAHWPALPVDAAVTLFPKGPTADCRRRQPSPIPGDSKTRPPVPPHPQTHSRVMLPDRLTTLGFFLAILLALAPGGLIDRGRQAAAPITPYQSLTR